MHMQKEVITEVTEVGYFLAREILEQPEETSATETTSYDSEKLREEVIGLRKKESEQLAEIANRVKVREQQICDLLIERQELLKRTKKNETQVSDLNKDVQGLNKDFFGDMEDLRKQAQDTKPKQGEFEGIGHVLRQLNPSEI